MMQNRIRVILFLGNMARARAHRYTANVTDLRDSCAVLSSLGETIALLCLINNGKLNPLLRNIVLEVLIGAMKPQFQII